MKLSNFQGLDINALKGALLTNTNGAEFWIIGIGVDLKEHIILIHLQIAGSESEHSAVPWETIKDWEIQLRPSITLLKEGN